MQTASQKQEMEISCDPHSLNDVAHIKNCEVFFNEFVHCDDNLVVTEQVTKASIIADTEDLSQESEPGDGSDEERETTYLPPYLRSAN